MDALQIQILIIACLVAISCIFPGTFLVLRGVALMSDAISHAILLGIVVMFLFIGELKSPLLFFGAALAGLLTVLCTEVLINSGLLKKDAAIGIVFPLFFSIGVILVSRYVHNVHLDVDMILLGEIVFAPFNRLHIYGTDIGPQAFWVLLSVLLINMVFVCLTYKELITAIFDQDTALIMKFRPRILYYMLMALTSVTAVAAFDIVGAILVVAFMVTPPAASYLLASHVSQLLYIAFIVGIVGAVIGYYISASFDVSVAGSIAVVLGIIFLITLLLAPKKGIIARIMHERKYKKEIAKKILAAYIEYHHVISIRELMWEYGWSYRFAKQMVCSAIDAGIISKYQVIS